MLKENIANEKTIKIVCAGDSHTYGEGATDCFKEFVPPVIAGDLRKPNLSSPSYVNLLMNYFNKKSSSECHEIHYNSHYLESDILFNSDGTVSPLLEGKIKINVKAREILLQMKCEKNSGKANIYIDGTIYECIDTSIELLENNNYNIYLFNGLEDINHEIIIENAGSSKQENDAKPIYFYKIEAYSGSYITINSGIGSCNTSKYLNKFYDLYVAKHKPNLLILEAFSVNDWLGCTPLDIYCQNLAQMISLAKSQHCEVILLTVAPLLRARYPYNDIGVHYNEYIEASRKTATKENIKIADANEKMMKIMSILQSYENLMHINNSHVNDIGHLLYFESILEALDVIL